MQTEQVLVTCDVCGAKFAVPKCDAETYRYVIPAFESVDVRPGYAPIRQNQVDLCGNCLRKATVMRAVVETEEGYIGGHDMYGRKPTGRVKYSFIEEEG